jgi:signal transduction histidine kinase
VGFVAQGGGGMGLKGMRERLSALNGELRLGVRPGGGTRIEAMIPRAGVSEAVA